jgi:hypothetical protein
MDDLSDDEEAILRFLGDQLLQQASGVQVTHGNPYLRAQMEETWVRFARSSSTRR